MKILVIMGSHRKGNTYNAVKQIEEHFNPLKMRSFSILCLRMSIFPIVWVVTPAF